MHTLLPPAVQPPLGPRPNRATPTRTRTPPTHLYDHRNRGTPRLPGCTGLSGQSCDGRQQPQAQTTGCTAAPARHTRPQPFQRQREPRPRPAGGQHLAATGTLRHAPHTHEHGSTVRGPLRQPTERGSTDVARGEHLACPSGSGSRATRALAAPPARRCVR